MTLHLSNLDETTLKTYYFWMEKKLNSALVLVAAKLKHYRLEIGKTQEAFAKKMGVSRTYYISIEGGRDIRTSTWIKIHKAFHVSLDRFYPTEQEYKLLSSGKLKEALASYEKRGS